MSSENSEILIRALEASGSEREAKLARAILGEAPVASAPAAAAAAAPAPGVADVSALPPAAQALAAELAARTPAGHPPGGELTRDDLKSMTAGQIAKLDPALVNAALAGS